jgi:hypothetical protein
MNASSMLLSRQGQYLLQIGMILIFYSSFDGFAIPFLSSPRIGLSVHTLSALQAIFLLAQGLLCLSSNLASLPPGLHSGVRFMGRSQSWPPTQSQLSGESAARQ